MLPAVSLGNSPLPGGASARGAGVGWGRAHAVYLCDCVAQAGAPLPDEILKSLSRRAAVPLFDESLRTRKGNPAFFATDSIPS
jgi:hypothetical protein